MTPTLKNDTSLLTNIAKYQNKIIGVLKDFDCELSASSTKALYKSEYGFDLCAMYMAQIGENVNHLTEETKADVSKYIDIGTLKYFRNLIDHSYEKVKKSLLQAYIQAVISPECVKGVRDILKSVFDRLQ